MSLLRLLNTGVKRFQFGSVDLSMAESSSGASASASGLGEMWKCTNPTCPMQAPLAMGKMFNVCPICQTACNSAAADAETPTTQKQPNGAETAALGETPTEEEVKVTATEQSKQEHAHKHQVIDVNPQDTGLGGGNLPKESSQQSSILAVNLGVRLPVATEEATSPSGSSSTPSKFRQQVSY